MKHIKLLGYGLARFHEAAGSYPGILPDIELVYRDIQSRMEQYFADDNVKRAMKQKLDIAIELPNYRGLLDYAYSLADRTTLHMDFVRSNLLFDDTNAGSELAVETLALSGILDLEKAARGNVVFDVARTLAFLMVDCNKPEAKLRKYFLDSGYIKRGVRNLKPMYFEGIDMLEQLINMFLIYDLYKLLRQNPYESLSDNHHFVQTRDILKQRKVIQ
jgi:Ser/Thr protein kinase RdoA (MazF antagonist)